MPAPMTDWHRLVSGTDRTGYVDEWEYLEITAKRGLKTVPFNLDQIDSYTRAG